MFSLDHRQQSLVLATLLAAVALTAARHWREARREDAPGPLPPSTLHDLR